MSYDYLKKTDVEIYDYMKAELERQQRTIELIASENIVSEAVMETMGSFLTNKYSEGYPSARYYGGCEEVDKVEQIAIDRAKELFGAEFANVQTHSIEAAQHATLQQFTAHLVAVHLDAATGARRSNLSARPVPYLERWRRGWRFDGV